MKRARVLLFTLVLLSLCPASRAAAWDDYPDWQAGEPVARVGGGLVTSDAVREAGRDCTDRLVYVRGYLAAQACVTEMEGWRYALFTHRYVQYGLETTETLFVIGIGTDSALSVVSGMPTSLRPLGSAAADTLVYHVSQSGGSPIVLYRHFLASLTRTGDGYALSDTVPERAAYADGTPVVAGGLALSRGGEWLAAQTPDGIVRMDIATGDVRRVRPADEQDRNGNGINRDLAVSDDGQIVAAGGRLFGHRELLVLTLNDGCGTDDPADDAAAWACPERDVTPLFDGGFLPDGWPVGLRLGVHGKRLDFYVERPDGFNAPAALYPYGSAPLRVRYLALGDSFSSGEGDVGRTGTDAKYYLPHTDDAAAGETCHLSSRSFPFQLDAAGGGADLDLMTRPVESVACSGARIDDIAPGIAMYDGQTGRLAGASLADLARLRSEALDTFVPGRVRQSAFVEEYQPAAVTLTVGGNDIQFSQVIQACVYSLVTCDYAADPVDRRNLGESIGALLPRLTDLYASLARSDPSARIYAVGYPRFINESHDPCPLSTNLDIAERRMVDEGVRYINRVVRAAAETAGVGYLDVEDALAGHRVCDGPDEYVNAIDVLGGQEKVETFHPNASGHGALAAVIRAQAGTNLSSHHYCPGGTYPCPHPADTPPLPSFFGDGSVRPTYVALPSELVAAKDGRLAAGLVKGAEFVVQASLLLAGSTARMELHSDAVSLGSVTAGPDGTVRAVLRLPPSVTAGYHTLHVYATSPSGEAMDMYQVVDVTDPASPSDVLAVPSEPAPADAGDALGGTKPGAAVRTPPVVSVTPQALTWDPPALPAVLPRTGGHPALAGIAALIPPAAVSAVAGAILWRRRRS